ncbi:unnamed protein product [Alternaria burnsii]|nr:unnamed protein product [Alternaria burnsii]
MSCRPSCPCSALVWKLVLFFSTRPSAKSLLPFQACLSTIEASRPSWSSYYEYLCLRRNVSGAAKDDQREQNKSQ